MNKEANGIMKKAKRKAHRLICALLIFVFVFTTGVATIPAASYPTSTESEYNFSGTSISTSEPGVKIEKSAAWTNIEEGEATITITEQDTAHEVYSPIDYIIVMDRSDSVSLDLHYTEWYGAGWNPQCPCLNKDHHYSFYGCNWLLDSYDFGLCTASNNASYQAGKYYAIDRFNALPWNYHYKNDGTALGAICWSNAILGDNKSIFTGEGCKARFECEKEAALAFLDQIKNYDNTQIAKLPADQRANALHSRVAFWAFSSLGHEQILDQSSLGPKLTVYEEFAVSKTATTALSTPKLVTNDFSQYGITSYIGFTPINTGENTIKSTIDSVKVGGGTYYDPSYHLAYDLISSRNGTAYEGVPVCFIFMTDGLDSRMHWEDNAWHCYENGNKVETTTSFNQALNHVTVDNWRNALAVTNYADSVTIAGIYVGSTGVDATGTQDMSPYLLKYACTYKKIGSQTVSSFYSIGTNTGYDTAAFSTVFNSITQSASHTSATDRILTDKVSDKWEIVSASNNGTIDHDTNTVTWKLGASDAGIKANGAKVGTSTKLTRTIQVKLKDEYRYENIKEIYHETNVDTESAKGATLTWSIQSGMLHGQTRSIETATPYLKYGTMNLAKENNPDNPPATKNWTVEGAEANEVEFNLIRTNYEKDGGKLVVAKEITTAEEDYTVGFTKRNQGKEAPLIYYDEEGNTLEYRIEETVPDGYTELDKSSIQTENQISANSLNRPNRVMIELEKTDEITGSILKDAEFSIYQYSGNGDTDDFANYVPYCFESTSEEGGTLLTDKKVSVIYNEEKGLYSSTDWLIYTDTNQGKFKLVESVTPDQYYGDWQDGVTPDKDSTDVQRNSYDIQIPLTPNSPDSVVTITKDGEMTFTNMPQRGELTIKKSGEVAEVTFNADGSVDEITYNVKALPGAWYVLRAADDIKDREGYLYYHKDDFINITESEQYTELTDLDLSMYVDENLDLDDRNKTDVSGNSTGDANEMFGIYIDPDKKVLVDEDGTEISSVYVTDENGEVVIPYIPLGDYYVVEVKAPTGYARVEGKDSIQYVSFEPVKNDYTEFIKHTLNFKNPRQLVNVDPADPTPPPIIKDNNPAIEVIKTTDKEYYRAGETATYTVTVTNVGDVDLRDVTLTDFMEEGLILSGIGEGIYYPAGSDSANGTEETPIEDVESKEESEESDEEGMSVSANSIEGLPIVTIPELNVYDKYTITYDYTIPEDDIEEGTSYRNVVKAEGTSVPDEEYGIPAKKVYDTDDEKIVVVDEEIAVIKEADKEVYNPGDTVTYHITVINPTNSPLYDISVEDYFTTAEADINSLEFLYSDKTDRITGKNGTVAIQYLDAGETADLYFSYTIPSSFTGDVIDNEVTVAGYGGEPNLPHIRVDKSLSYGDITGSYVHKAGDTVDYYITVKNDGTLNLTDVTLDDSLPGKFVSIIDMTNSGIETVSENDIKEIITMDGNQVLIKALPIGGEITFKYQYKVPKNAKGGKIIDNIVDAKGTALVPKEDGTETPEEVTDEDDEEIIITDEGTPHISVTKKVLNRNTYHYGEIATYEIVVINDGNVDLTDVVLDDTFGVDNVDWLDNLDENIGELAVGERAVRRYRYQIPEDTATAAEEDSENEDSENETEDDAEDESESEDATEPVVVEEKPNTVTVTGKGQIPDGNGGTTEKEVTDKDDEIIYIIDLPAVTDDDDEEVIVRKPSIDVTKEAVNGTTFEVGDEVEYHITVKNTGNIDLTNVSLRETLIDGMFDDTSLNTDMPEANSDNGECENIMIGTDEKRAYINIGDLAVGETKDIYYYYTVKETDKDGNVYNVVIASGETDPEDPKEPPIIVEDEDDEVIRTTLKVGVRKLMVDGDHNLHVGEGALFGLYAAEDIFVLTSDEPIIEKDTLIETSTTDADGYANFVKDLPVGNYYVKELKAPAGCYSTDAIVYIDGTSQKYNDQISIVYRGGIIRNAEMVVIVELDDDRTMHELNNGILEVRDSEGNTVSTWVTKNQNGKGYMIHGLNPDTTYEIHEKMAPQNYVNSIIHVLSKGHGSASATEDDRVATFSVPDVVLDCDNDVTSETYGKYTDESLPEPLHIQITNDWVVGDVHLLKTGDFLEDQVFMDKVSDFFKSLFGFDVDSLEGAEFSIYAKEDIYYPDGSYRIFKAGDLVKEGVKTIEKDAIAYSDAEGNVNWAELYLGHYEIVETKGIDGYKISDEPIEFWLSYLDDRTPVVYASCQDKTVHNPMQIAQIEVVKTCAKTGNLLANAEFGVYAKDNIVNRNGDVIIEKDTLLETGMTNENGILVFESNLPVGYNYYVKEIKAPNGYLLNEETFEIEVPIENYTEAIKHYSISVTNEPDPDVSIEVDKVAPDTAVAGENMDFTIVKVANHAYLPVDDFTMTDNLPDQTKLVELRTGVYSHELTYSVYYTTNKRNTKQLWRSGLSTTVDNILSVSELGLSGDEYVNGFSIEFGTVPGKFENVSNPSYTVYVKENTKVGSKLINHISLDATFFGKPLNSKDKTTTITVDPENPKTGDSTPMMVAMILLGIALITGCGYSVWRKRRKIKG